MSELVKLGNIPYQTIGKLANAMNKIPNTEIGTANAIKIVEKENELVDEAVDLYINTKIQYSDQSQSKSVFETKRSLFDGTGEAARAVRQRLDEER